LFHLPLTLRAALALEKKLSRLMKFSGYFGKKISQQQHTKNIKWLNTMYLFMKCVILL
jgi:V8-like Glu-specific endopeptidase